MMAEKHRGRNGVEATIPDPFQGFLWQGSVGYGPSAALPGDAKLRACWASENADERERFVGVGLYGDFSC